MRPIATLMHMSMCVFFGSLPQIDAQEKSYLGAPGCVPERPTDSRYVEVDGGFMVPYQQPIPGTDHSIWMEPIQAPSEAKHPNSKLFAKPSPFWMARYEATHADYLPYMKLYRVFKEFDHAKIRPISGVDEVDAVTAPTEIYDPSYAFEYGVEMQHPVGTMTLYCARQYTKWLSKLTGSEFRLPTVREWEHACRAGGTTKWHFGNNPDLLAQYAWFNQVDEVPGYRKVGQLQPNDWGLYDMHGNMAEWVLQPGVTSANKQILKGGCWEFPAAQCTVDSVLPFDDDAFRAEDANVPLSPWWLASHESRWVGFRIIRPLNPMNDAERKFAWECHNEDEQLAVEMRLDEGRGALGKVDPELPAAVESLPKR
ncbi:MAG: formylglycine-generating enzyme family protein [Planctomycetota bacterium]